jgi:transcriptional antiterminator RfaH
MPIREAITDINLPKLFERPEVWQGEDERHWWVLQTRARCEKVLLEKLGAMGEIEFYGSMLMEESRSPNGRQKTVQHPLFSNYVFLYGNEEDRRKAMTTNCVAHALHVPDHEQRKLTVDLRQFFTLILNHAPLTPVDQLIKGDPVHIKAGPLKGIIGTFIKREQDSKVLIACDFLQKGALVSIEKCNIEPI